MKTYATMKNSGVAWLGDIPAEWNQKHAKYLFNQVKESVGDDPSKYELLSLTLRGIIPRSQVEGGKNPDNYSAYQVVHENDLIMCLFDYDVTPRTVGRSTQTGMVTGAYTNLRPNTDISTRYYNYFFLALDNSKELLHLCTGLRNGLSKTTFFELNLPVPDYETQQRIADYLDRETAQIDDLIAKQQRLLELLEEKRRATITHAVTRGLNPHAELKETNIPWLGQIPAHWELTRLKYMFTINDEALSQKTDPETEFEYVDISSVDKYEGIIKRENMTFVTAPSRARRIVKSGDIILGAVRTYLEAIVQITPKDKEVIVSTGFAVLRPEHASDSDFYSWAIRSGAFMASVVASSDGVSYPAINSDKLAALCMPLPPKNERDNITQFVSNEMAKMDALKAKILTQIDLLKERRTSLISNAVTGKIKV
jgi:type I restriction enzyme S subunit